MRSPRFWVIVVLLSFSALVLHVRGDVDRVPYSRPLSEMPTTLGNRSSTEIPLNQETLDVLGKGDFLYRLYSPDVTAPKTRDAQSPISLFIGYFATQRTGQSIHSPQNCLPGAGWSFLSSGVTEFSDATGKTYRVGDYLISDGKATEEVLYWYQMHGRSIANDYVAKLYTLADSIEFGRTDAALVRIITNVGQGEERDQARNRAVEFARQITPLLPAYVPN
jgi:EpsI family protein